MPARKTTPKVAVPIAPEPPSETRVGEHAEICADDKWEDERVLDANLAGQLADRARLTRCELHRVALTGAQLRGLALVDVLAVDCELSGAFLHEAMLRRVELRNCRMAGVVFSQASLSHVRFVDCKLDEANLRLLRADHVEMTDCSMASADLYEARFEQSTFDGCDLRGSDFSRASVEGLRLMRSRLDGVRGAMRMGGVVIGGEQVLPVALSLFADLHIEIQNEEP